MTEILTGRCLCGAIRYRLGPLLYPPTLCHCESCRRASAAHAIGWLTVRTADLTLTGAAPREFASSPGVVRSFCSTCGTPLIYRSEQRPLETDITLCSLDEPGRAPPVDHIWMQDAPEWDLGSGCLPRHPRGRR